MEDKTYNIYLHPETHVYHEYTDEYKESKPQGTATAAASMIEPLRGRKKPFRLTRWRWLALVLMNLVLIGYFAVFDSPQPLETAIKATLQVNDQQYSCLYSFLAIPNIILPVIAGYIVDIVGVRLSMTAFALLVFVGQVILAFGAYILDFNVMVAGRVVYSLGADPLNIAQIVMVNRWFKGSEVALALSLATFMAGAGKAFCSAIIPVIYDMYGNLEAPLGFGAILCLFSLVCVIIMVIWDKANEQREIALDPEYFQHTENAEKVDLRDIRKFSLMVWLLVFNFGIFDGVVFTLRSFLNDFYHNAYGYSTEKAGNFISSHYIVMAIASPIMGKVIDKYGLRSSIVFYNSFLGIIAMLFYVLVPTCDQCATPIIPLVLMGVCVGVDDAAVFASLPLVLDEKYLGTGYGLYYVVENILLTVLPPIAGTIKGAVTDEITGYFWVSVFVLCLAVVATLESAWLFLADRRRNKVLDDTIHPELQHHDDSSSEH